MIKLCPLRYLAAVNHSIPGTEDVSVSLCGQPEAVNAWLESDEAAVELRPLHPWHHPAYRATKAFEKWGTDGGLSLFSQPKMSSCAFLSTVTVRGNARDARECEGIAIECEGIARSERGGCTKAASE